MNTARQFNAGPSTDPAPTTWPTSPRTALGDFPRSAARHPFESISPAGLVLVALVMVSAGVVLAAMLKAFSMLRMVLS
jgi:hypothetical protein